MGDYTDILYCCGTFYLNKSKEGIWFEDINKLKTRYCWGTCGIVEVTFDEFGNELSHRWVEKGTIHE